MKTWLKGGLIGIIISIFFIISGLIGTFTCNWNPAEGSVVPDGICKNPLMIYTFYGPTILAYYSSAFLFRGLSFVVNSDQLGTFFYFFIPSITLLVIGFVIGILISTLIKDVKTKNDYKPLIFIFGIILFFIRVFYFWLIGLLIILGVIIWWIYDKIKGKK